MSAANHEIVPLNDEERHHLAQQRQLPEQFLDGDEAHRQYATPAGKLGLVQAILDHNVFTAEQPYELQCLGVILGDAVVQHLEMEWVTVVDEDGRSTAVHMPKTSIILFPVTMIHRRLMEGTAGPDVDVFGLFNNALAQVGKLMEDGV